MMRKIIYLALIERLRACCTAIGHISLWNDNVAELERESGYLLPAVFVEFDPIRYKQGGQGTKSATVQVRLHIVTESLADPSDGSRYREDALEVFALIDQVVNAISGMGGDCYNRLMHVETIPDHNHDSVQHHIEVFVCEAVWALPTAMTSLQGVKPSVITTR